MNNLVYLSYGAGPHEQEIAFSVLSAYRWLGVGRPDWRIVVYTDRPDSFSPLGVATVRIDAMTLDEWAGPWHFQHRRKIMALRDALQRYKGPTTYLDGDTYFRRSPKRLFDRIAPGRSVMHLREGVVNSLPGSVHAALRAALRTAGPMTDLSGEVFSITSSASMWNAGVVGVHPSDGRALDEALHLTDQLCHHLQIHTLEQFAVSVVLSRYTQLSEAADAVFHYWEGGFRVPFRRQLPQVLERHASMPLAERARLCYRARPRSSLRDRFRSLYYRLLRGIGRMEPVVRSSQ